MKTEKYLAFDLGAGSGRAILGELDGRDRLKIHEIHRFNNPMVNILGSLHWNVTGLYEEMLHGMQICAKKHTKEPKSIGIDTWGVDFALFDRKGNMLGIPYTYRDKRNDGASEYFLKKMTWEKLYKITGIQKLSFNTVFQLASMVRDKNPQLELAEDLLFIPDIFTYFFTGVMKSEFSFATTSQLYNPNKHDWDDEIFRKLSINKKIMQKIVQPGTVVGKITSDISHRTGLKTAPFSAVATHDTGSAVAAVPAESENYAYISCGTWMLAGIETKRPVINEKTIKYSITNEGGVDETFRVLKNITGLWLQQKCKQSWDRHHNYSYAELTDMAAKEKPFTAFVNPDHPSFSNPKDMPSAITEFCRRTKQKAPQAPGRYVRVILESLALATKDTIELLKNASGKEINKIHTIGGGSQNRLLMQFIADATGMPVYAGPVEATAIGNILVQAMATGRVKNLKQLREIVRNSFQCKIYEPKCSCGWEEAYEKFRKLKKFSY